MNFQQEIQLQWLEAHVQQLAQQLTSVNSAIHSLRCGNQPASLQRPIPIATMNQRWFGNGTPNPYAGARVSSQHQPLPWEMPHGYSPELRDPSRPLGFIKPDTMSHVFFYEQDCYVLSNFSAFKLQWDGEDFDTAEAAYHWEKFPCFPEIRKQIRDARSAHEAYQIAAKNKAHRRPDWDLVKVGIMKEILRAKVDQDEYVKRKLLETGDRMLIEDSWRDDFWGWGPERTGQNKLGQLWMEIRTELLNYQEDQMKPEVPGIVPRATENQPGSDNGDTSSQCDTVTVPAEYFLALEKVTLSLIPNLHYQLVHHSNCAHLHRPSNACDCDRRHIAKAAKKAKRIRETLPLTPL